MQDVSRRRFLASASASAATLAVAAGVPGLARAQTALAFRVSSGMAADQNAAHYLWFQRFNANLKDTVGDKIKLDYFPDNQLGKEADVVQGVKVGSIDMMITGSSIWATVAPEFGMLDLGYVFDSYAHVARALDGGVGDSLSKILYDRTACTVLGWGSHFTARSVYGKTSIKNLAEVKNVKLRVLPTPAFIDTFKIMGAIPTPIPINELYTALQTGVVEGFEHDAGSVITYKLFEVVKYCWLTEHLFSPMIAVIGKRGMDKIPAQLRPAFLKAATDATKAQRIACAEKGQSAYDELKRLGITFAPMAKNEREFVRGEMQNRLWSAFAKEYAVTKPLFDAINAARA